jgi:hypothetical protein
LDPTLFGQYAAEPTRPPPGQWLSWLMQPTLMAQQGQAEQFQTPLAQFPAPPAMAPHNPVLSPRGSVPLPRPAATGAPRTTWRGGVLPFTGDEDGNLHFDTDAGQIGAAKRAAMMPGEVWAGRIDPMSEEGIQGALELQGLLGLGPAGSAAKAANSLKSLESRSAEIYAPPVRPQRSFEADYPHGARADQAGNLTQDIEGRPLIAEHVVGRRMVGGGDQSLTPSQFATVAERSIGTRPEAITARELGRGKVGAYRVGRGKNGPERDIVVLNSLSPDEYAMIVAHEIGHMVDDLAGKFVRFDKGIPVNAIPQAGIKEELKRIYNDLNNSRREYGNPSEPARYGQPMRPEQAGYKNLDVPPEYMAEAIRAYMANPNYIKTVAPKTAAAIRKAVNNNPRLNRIIQFNAGGVPMPGAPMSDEEFQKAYWDGNAT